jgi:HK97 gp10 family phage protein
MGKFDFEISADFLRTLGRLEDVDRVAPQMIDEAIPILEASVKREAAKHVNTGDMLASIKRTKAGKNKRGYYAAVRPTGKDRNGMDNMTKMAYLEYGTSKQAATPTLTKALKDSEQAVLDKMQEVFNREVGGR